MSIDFLYRTHSNKLQLFDTLIANALEYFITVTEDGGQK